MVSSDLDSGTTVDLNSKSSSQLCEEANKLYRCGNLTEALELYIAAINLDPSDLTPRRNLSSANFELGDYTGCLEAIDRALLHEQDPEKLRVLKLRQAKCFFYLGKFSEIKQTLAVSGDEEAVQLLKAAKGYEVQTDITKAREELVESPMLRPCLEWFPGEYFPHGHDCAFPAIRWNKLVERRTSLGSPLDLAFFHGGIGDARHLYQQLHNIYAYKIEWQRGIVSSRYPVDNIFFAVQDIKPHIIARNMMVFRLLHDISTIPTRIQSEKAQKKEHELLLAAVWYVYGCEIMPVYIHKLLVSMMKAMIRSAGNFQIPWVRCNTKTTAAIVSVFEGWLENQNLDGIFGIAYMQDKNTLGKRLNEYHGPLDADWWPYSNISRSLHFEHDQYQKTRLVYPPPLIMKDEEPELTTIFLGNDESLNNIELIKEYARKNWVPNFTRIADAELYEGHGHTLELPDDVLTILEDFIREATVYALKPIGGPFETDLSIIELSFPFFQSCADILSKGEIIIECSVDSLYHQLEDIHLSPSGGQTRKYDAIFISNVPDNMGGYLTTSMYCLPLLKTDLVYPGFIQSNILANSERFTEGVSRAFAEYTCLSRAFAEKVLGITLVGREPFADVSPGTVITTDNEHPNAPRWLETSMVYRWGLSRCSELPEKAMFTRWMMQVFYKLSLPPPADIRMSSGRLAQPLTMLTFLKLCGFLVHTRGIPSHWVGGFIDSILSGFIISTARPPSTSPLVLYEVVAAKSNKSARKFCTEAFVVELRSLLIRHRHALSLRFCTPLFGNVAIYALKFVVKVSKDHSRAFNNLGLVFMEPYISSRDVEKLYQDLVAAGTRGRMHLVSNFKLEKVRDIKKNIIEVRAQWWMEEAVVGDMRKEGWKAMILRSDKWEVITEDAVIV